jgi:hypothetical protein
LLTDPFVPSDVVAQLQYPSANCLDLREDLPQVHRIQLGDIAQAWFDRHEVALELKTARTFESWYGAIDW